MKIWLDIFGEGKDLNVLQMGCRGVVVFVITLALIRISGRRSFGLRMPVDNIIAILLGAILSRAVVGASDFLPVIVTCFVIVLLHRWFSWLVMRHSRFAQWVEGNKILLFENGEFKKDNIEKALVCREDIMQGVRKSALTGDLDKIDKIYMERNGDISPVKK